MRPRIMKFALFVLIILWITPACLFAQTVGSAIQQQLENAGIDSKMAKDIVKGTGRETGIPFNLSLYDRVDFATFPDARLNVQKLKAHAALVLTPQLTGYVFRGKSDSFQGSFRTYEFHLGQGVQKACSMLFSQVFEVIRGLSGPQGISPHEVVIVPRLDEFRFKFGGVWKPMMYVTLKMGVAVFAGGKPVLEKSYSVKDIKEGTNTIFPNADQEHRAISKAMLVVLKQAAREIANHPVLLAYNKPAPSVASKEPVSLGKKIDMDTIVFLAGTKEDYAKNYKRLTPAERTVAKKFLRLKLARANSDIDRQLDEINGLIRVASKLEPVSRNELLEEIKYFKKDTDIELIERNAFEDKIYNFAGDYTETVLDYAGAGITLVKVGFLAAGCIYSAGTLCPALVTTMASFEAADIAAEGIGAASEELIWKSGDVSESLFQGAKASLVEFGAGKLGGKLASGALGKSALKASRERAVAAALKISRAGGGAKLARETMNRVFVDSMTKTLPTQKAALGSFIKSRCKNFAQDVENLFTQDKASGKTLNAPDFSSMIKAAPPDFDLLNKL